MQFNSVEQQIRFQLIQTHCNLKIKDTNCAAVTAQLAFIQIQLSI